MLIVLITGAIFVCQSIARYVLTVPTGISDAVGASF
jgi:hypothetical protein